MPNHFHSLHRTTDTKDLRWRSDIKLKSSLLLFVLTNCVVSCDTNHNQQSIFNKLRVLLVLRTLEICILLPNSHLFQMIVDFFLTKRETKVKGGHFSSLPPSLSFVGSSKQFFFHVKKTFFSTISGESFESVFRFLFQLTKMWLDTYFNV